MKIYTLIILCLAITIKFYAQSGTIEYEYIDKQHNVLRKSLLLFNENKSIYIENRKGLNKLDKYNAKLIFQFPDREPEVEYSEREILIDNIGNLIFRNFKDKLVKQRVIQKYYFDNVVDFVVDDLWVDLDWVILDSLKLIEGFNCRKATTNFRGRKYDVWFTDSIQVPYGPWKLFDLPGLILEMLEVEENLLFITAKKITYPINTELVINEPNEKTIVSVKELDAFMEKQAELRWEAAKSELPRGFNIGRGKRTEPYFFRKLERKYEWE